MIWPYILLSYISLFLFGLIDNMRGPIYPELIQEFAVSNTKASWFYGIASTFHFLGGWWSVFILKRIDRVQNLYVALGFLILGTWGWSQSQNFNQLLVFSCLTGFGFGLLSVSYNILATIGSHPIRRQRVLSGLHTMYGLSSFIAPLFVAMVYSQGFSWRQVFLLSGCICLVFLAGSYFFIRREKGSEENFEHKLEAQEIAGKTPRGVNIVGVAFALYVMAEILIGSRLALFLRTEKAFDLISSSYYVTGFFLCLLSSRILFSFVHPKIEVRKQLMISLGLSCLLMLLGIFVHEIFLIITGFAMGPFYALGIMYLSEAFPRHLNVAMATSMSMQGLFVVLMHVGSGAITDSAGVNTALLMGPLCLITSVFLFWIFPRWTRR